MDLIMDILVRYKGLLFDLFREGYFVVVEGFIKLFSDEVRKEVLMKFVFGKVRGFDCFFLVIEVLVKYDEKYMFQEVVVVIEKNKKIIEVNYVSEEVVKVVFQMGIGYVMKYN